MTDVTDVTITKDLKKSNFLAAVPSEPTLPSKLQIKLKEEGFDFLDSWFLFMIEHFVDLGKINQSDDGTIWTKVKSVSISGPRVCYRVEFNTSDEKFYFEEKSLVAGEAMTKGEGWAQTQARAVKHAVSAEHRLYSETIASIKELLPEPEVNASDELKEQLKDEKEAA